MILMKADFWSIYQNFEIACITTNGFVKSNGCGVMGRGIALQAAQKFPRLPLLLGTKVSKNGNRVQSLLIVNKTIICAFPVKHNWWEEADIELIKCSCRQLMSIINKFGYHKVLLNMPGVGNGKLDFNDVREAIESLLDDRITVVFR